MITMTNEQIEKIDLLDRLFGAFNIEQLKEITETEQVVAILKGTNNNPGILKRLIQEHDILHIDTMNLKSETAVLRSDIQTLAKLVLKPYDYNSANDAQTLKSKYSIF